MEGLFPRDLPLILRGWKPGFQEEDTASLFICPQPIFFPSLASELFLWLVIESYSNTRKIMGRGRNFSL